jgi:hypothetical protein
LARILGRFGVRTPPPLINHLSRWIPRAEMEVIREFGTGMPGRRRDRRVIGFDSLALHEHLSAMYETPRM